MSTATRTYQIRIAEAGSTEVTDLTTALTLSLADLTAVPLISGPSVDVLGARSTSHPFQLRCLIDDPLFVTDGRLTELGRLAEVRTSDDDGMVWTERATGRITYAGEPNGRGEVVLEIGDERWVERRTTIFRTTDTMQLHPPGLASAWKDRPAAGTSSYIVQEVDGTDYVRIRPGDDEFGGFRYVPPSLRDALATDVKPQAELSRDSGNFESLRFHDGAGNREVVNFGLYRSVGFGVRDPLGDLRPDGSGALNHAWLYFPSHGLSVGSLFGSGRFHFPSGVAASDSAPLHVGGVSGIHVGTLLRQVLDGDFGGQVVRYDEASMAAVEALPLSRVWLRTGPAERAKWTEASIYRAIGVLPLVGTDLKLRPTPLRQPQDVDPDTLVVLDATNAELPRWEHTSRDLATVVSYKSRLVRALENEEGQDKDWPADELELVEQKLEYDHDNATTLGEVVHEVDTALVWVFPPGLALAKEVFDVVGDGAQLGSVIVPEDSDVEVGQVVLLDQQSFQAFNPATAARTGKRLVMLLTFREVSAAAREFDFLDLGPNSQPLVAPSVSIVQNVGDADLVDVTISGLAAGSTATVEVATGTVEPDEYQQTLAGVGNETISFRVDAASGTAYVRARATAPHRISSAYVTDSVALTARAMITAADVVMTAREALVTWTVPSGTGGMRTDYAIHRRGEDPSFGSNQQDHDATDGGFTITGLLSRQAVSVQLTPYPGFAAGSVTGAPGDFVIRQAFAPRVTGGIATLPPVRIVDPRTDWTPAGGLRVRVNTEGAQYVRVAVSTSAFPSEATVDAATAQAVDANGFVEVSDAGPFGLGEDAFIGVKAYEFASGDTAASALVTVQATRPATTVPRIAMAVAQSGQVGSMDLTITDPTLSVTNVQFAEKTGAGSYGSLATTWDRSTGTLGSDAVLTRGEDITLASKHAVSVRWVVTYDDEQGTSRTLEGAHSFDSDLIAEVTNVGVAFDANGNAVVSVSGDEDTAGIYVTVGDGVDPPDPTIGGGGSDGFIVGREGVIETSVKITTGNDAHVKVGAVDAADVFGPIVSARQERRIGPFHRDNSSRNVTGTTTATVLETITVPANKLGLNGVLRLTVYVEFNGINGFKTLRFLWGGNLVPVLTIQPVGAYNGSAKAEILLSNIASASSQQFLVTKFDELNTIAINQATAEKDTTSDVDLEIQGQLDDAGDEIDLLFTLAEYLGTS
jgi:hypothetical protein